MIIKGGGKMPKETFVKLSKEKKDKIQKKPPSTDLSKIH